METNKTVDISALMKKPKEKVVESSDIQTGTEKKDVQKAGVTINVSAIKSNKKDKEVEEIIEQKAEVKDKQTLFYESLTSNVLQEGNIDLKKEKLVLDTSRLKKTNESKCEKIMDKDGEEKEVCSIEQKAEKSLFKNYESDYQKKQSSVIETLRKLKKAADIKNMTKTNKVFVSGIILTTILGVSFLFYIDPETHSLENYKTSILTLAGREISQENLDQHQIDIQNDISWQLNENNLGGYQLDFEILVGADGNAIYKFDGEEYNSKEDLDAAIKEKLEVLKKEKIREYLKQKSNL